MELSDDDFQIIVLNTFKKREKQVVYFGRELNTIFKKKQMEILAMKNMCEK